MPQPVKSDVNREPIICSCDYFHVSHKLCFLIGEADIEQPAVLTEARYGLWMSAVPLASETRL